MALTPQERDKVNEALLALVTLGYRQSEAKAAIERVLKKAGQQVSIENLIKLALQEF